MQSGHLELNHQIGGHFKKVDMNKNFAVIGNGFVGGSLTTVFHEKGFDVFVYDKAGKAAGCGPARWHGVTALAGRRRRQRAARAHSPRTADAVPVTRRGAAGRQVLRAAGSRRQSRDRTDWLFRSVARVQRDWLRWFPARRVQCALAGCGRKPASRWAATGDCHSRR